MELFQEGRIKFFAVDKQTRSARVFFNPIRSFDRDMNVLFFKALGKKSLSGIDLFAGSGIRGLRLAAETNAFASMEINDVKTSKTIEKNVKLNKSVLKAKVSVSHNDAMSIFSSQKGYDYLDIDPFGSPVKYMMQAVPKVKYGGVLSITATDTAALYGKARKACELKYGAKSFRTSYFNEIGLRILIRRAEEIANIYGRSIRPLFFDVRKHYVRVYLSVGKPDISRKMGFVYQCLSCPARTIGKYRDKCAYCSEHMVEIGPLWLDKLFDRQLVKRMSSYAEDEKAREYLSAMGCESDEVSYYTTDEMSSYLKQKEMKIDSIGVRTVLNEKGFRTSGDIAEIIAQSERLELP